MIEVEIALIMTECLFFWNRVPKTALINVSFCTVMRKKDVVLERFACNFWQVLQTHRGTLIDPCPVVSLFNVYYS